MPASRRRSLAYVELDTLTPADRNAKGHDAGTITRSVGRFGFIDPIVLDERTGKLIAGHGRRDELLRARDAGEPAPDGVIVKAGKWTVPVVRGWASADDLEADAAGVALNRTVEAGGWDTEQLAAILADVAESEAGLIGVGFDSHELDAMIASLATEPETPPDRDEIPDRTSANPVTVRGDVWRCGPHRVMCGDSFEADARAVLLEGVDVAAAIMDPPFAIYGSASGISASVADDKMVRPFFEQLGRVLYDVLPWFGHSYTCCDWRSYATLWDGYRSASMTPKNCLVWDKGSFGMGNNWANAHEFLAYFTKMPPDRTMKSGQRTGQRQVVGRANILRYPRVTGDEREHNAAKPVALLTEVIEAATDPGEWIIDLFGGSGSVLAAGNACGRLVATMEYEPAWVDVICARYERLTGELPVLERTGKAHSFVVE